MILIDTGARDRWLLQILLLLVGGGMGIRTPDPDLAKVVLYQLSYAPSRVEPGLACSQLVGLSGFEPETSRLSGVCSNQLSYKPIQVP